MCRKLTAYRAASSCKLDVLGFGGCSKIKDFSHLIDHIMADIDTITCQTYLVSQHAINIKDNGFVGI